MNTSSTPRNPLAKRVCVIPPRGFAWGLIAATFLGPVNPELVGETDHAWVRYEEGEREGTTGSHPFAHIKPHVGF